MFPGLDCTEAKFIREPAYLNASAGIRKANVTYRSDDCEIERTLDLADPTQWSQRQNKWAAENYMGVADVVNCSGIKRFLVAVTQADRSLTIKNYRYDHRYCTLAALTCNSALVCTPLHHVQDVLVHVAEDGQQDFEPQATSEVQGARINGFDATQAFSQIINATLSSNNRAASVQPSGDITEGNQPFLAVAAIPYTRSNPGSSYLRPLLDIQALNSSVASAFAGTLSLIVSEHMLRPDSDRLTGSLQYPEDRLHVEKAPSLIIAVLLLSCAGMALVMLFISPSSVVPINPNNIGGTAALIGPSSEIEDLSRTSFKETSNALDGRAFKSTFETQDQEAGQFRIIATSTTQKQRPKSSDEATESKDWCPFTLQMWVRAAAIFVCLAIIVALEILQRKSDRSSGFMDAKAGENVQLWSTVVPALLLTGLALLYSSIYTNIAVLAPYHALAGTKGAIAKRSIATEYLGSTPLFAIPPAVQQGHISTSVSAFAAVVGAFLTIVVSGLYYTQIVESRVPLEVQRGDEWNVTWPVGESDGAAGQTLQFTTWRNLTNPQWTHEDLVLPKVSLPTSEGNLSNNQKLTVVLPARRARLNCTATKPADVVISVDSSFTRVYSKVLNTCAGQSQQELPLALSISRPLDSYGGSDPLQLYFDPRGTFATAQIPSSKVPIANLANSSCPSIAFFFGSLPDTAPAQTNQTRLPMSPTRNLTSSEASGMTLACAQLIEEVDTAVTFLLPEWSIDQSAPIVPDESSTRQIGGVYQFPAVSSLISTFGVSSSNTTFQGDIMRHFGTFFAAVVHGKDGIPAEELLADEDRLIGAVSKLYGRYMAQVMTRKMRSPTGEQVFEASVTQQRARLMQHSSAKLGLQILLGVIVLCDLVSWAMMRRVRILPHSPCSIAGIACLLAGREFWGEKKQNWAADTRVFKIGLHNDKFGIYAMNDGGEHLRS